MTICDYYITDTVVRTILCVNFVRSLKINIKKDVNEKIKDRKLKVRNKCKDNMGFSKVYVKGVDFNSL